MKKAFIVTGCLISSVAFAAPVSQPFGSSFTLGSSANPASLMTSLGNVRLSQLVSTKSHLT